MLVHIFSQYPRGVLIPGAYRACLFPYPAPSLVAPPSGTQLLARKGNRDVGMLLLGTYGVLETAMHK